MADPYLTYSIPAAIAGGSALSAEVDIGGMTLIGIVFPANWSTAGLTFQASGDGGITFGELLDETADEIAIGSVAGGAYTLVAVDPTLWRGIVCLKIRSGTAAAPVNQSNNVVVNLLARFIS